MRIWIWIEIVIWSETWIWILISPCWRAMVIWRRPSGRRSSYDRPNGIVSETGCEICRRCRHFALLCHAGTWIATRFGRESGFVNEIASETWI